MKMALVWIGALMLWALTFWAVLVIATRTSA